MHNMYEAIERALDAFHKDKVAVKEIRVSKGTWFNIMANAQCLPLVHYECKGGFHYRDIPVKVSTKHVGITYVTE